MTQPSNELVWYNAQLPATVAGANLVPLAETGGIVGADTYWQRADHTEPVRVYDQVFLGNLTYLASDRSGYRDTLEEPVPGAGFSLVASQVAHGATWVHVRPDQGYRVQVMVYDEPTDSISWRNGYEDDNRVLVSQDRGMFDSSNPGGSSLREVLAGPEAAGTDLTPADADSWTKIQWGNPGLRTGIVRTIDGNGRVRYYALGVNFDGEADKWVVTGGVVEVEPMALRGQNQTAHRVGVHATKPAITAE